MSIDIAKGFRVNGLNCGIKNKKDIGFILSDRICNVAGVTTTSTTAAACVTYNRTVLSKGKAQLLIANSGNANAFTGKQGDQDVLTTVSKAAQEFKVDPSNILVASTGIIGKNMPMDKICQGIELLAASQENNLLNFSQAIRTTDLTDKIISRTIEVNGKTGIITGVTKGSGMIHPNMATMLAFIMTDIEIDTATLKQLISEINEDTFNMISVDGDTSTNDMAIIMSNNASGLTYQEASVQVKNNLIEVFTYLAKEIARDGEGAQKLIEVQVNGAANTKEARAVARAITRSPLIKTAIHGESSNIGRLVAAIGSTGAVVDMDKLQVSWQGLKTKEVFIEVNLGTGSAQAKAWGCDLSEEYIKINTDYN